jgi:hypothetical protein
MAVPADGSSPRAAAEETAADRARRLRLRAAESHARALRQARQARTAREAAISDRRGVQVLLRGLEADDRERRRAVRRWTDLIAGGGPDADRRGLAFFDADFCLVSDRTAMTGALLAAALRFSRAQMGNVQLFDAETGGLRIVAQQGFGPEFLRYFARVDDDRSACGVALIQARTVQVHDISQSKVFDVGPTVGVLLDAGVRAVRSIPLTGPGGEMLGVLSVHYARPHDPGATEQRLLAALADAAVRRLTRPTRQRPTRQRPARPLPG